MIYRRRASPLHAARAGVAVAWLTAIGVAVLTYGNPIVLGAILIALLAAGIRVRVGRQLALATAYLVPLAVVICVINALVTRQGFTVIWRFGDLPILGQTNVTLEATVYGAILGLRAVELIAIGALYSLTVDPDEVRKLMRPISFASALSATIATRMVPLLVRDGRRLADAQRCRPGPPPGRLALMRATTNGVLDRALDVAATLEVRGYSVLREESRGPHGRAVERSPFSRHDLAFAASTVVILGAIVAGISGLDAFRAYPSLYVPTGPGVVGAASILVLSVVIPTLSRRGVER